MKSKVITINSINYQLFPSPPMTCIDCAFDINFENCMAAHLRSNCSNGVWKEIKSAPSPASPASSSGSTFVYDKQYQTLILSRDNQEVQRMQVQPHELQALLQFLSDVRLSDLIVDNKNKS